MTPRRGSKQKSNSRKKTGSKKPRGEIKAPPKIVDEVDDIASDWDDDDDPNLFDDDEEIDTEVDDFGEEDWDDDKPVAATPEPTEAVAAEASDKPAKAHQWALFNLLRLRSQLVVSVLAGVAVVVVATLVRPSMFATSGDLTLFLQVLLGVGSVLALVATITFGFLLHNTQSLVAERREYYRDFRAGVKELRAFLSSLHEQGLLTEGFETSLVQLEAITLDDVPILHWPEIVDPIMKFTLKQQEYLDAREYEPLGNGMAHRLTALDEIRYGLFTNWLGRLLVKRMTEPVLKVFAALAVVMLMVMLAPLTFDLIPRAVSWGLNTSLGYLTFVFVVELTLIVNREMKEFDVLKSSGAEAA